uniref:Disintegrin domain-containing protein n=1 Tax=Chromera velia CCMP2878 TaxID=1169474 RepID=A0A0G4HKF9_9ALVE|eukprot:Cvel_7196.t1-p1 / transcript=Cvel_7196.t1 / gene=Cvel_7196 / organism=Chromera_velia_CCMP2878 / gene_product=hypothetical protein / transcript_product=hypothetical protein / location=Cvel_scaffold370:67279-67794(-) / protein_length=172 / sequence_SO=supercontig / SO=protein_coding / is_pseudo=false
MTRVLLFCLTFVLFLWSPPEGGLPAVACGFPLPVKDAFDFSELDVKSKLNFTDLFRPEEIGSFHFPEGKLPEIDSDLLFAKMASFELFKKGPQKDGDKSRATCKRGEDCSDEGDCTDDTCEDGECALTPNDAKCDDQVDCTVDTCDLTNGCQFTAQDTNCDDKWTAPSTPVI